jgi:cytoskeletal protein CcmA (bactofilin family)
MIGSTKKSPKPDTASENVVNRIAKGTVFEGVLRSENNVRIDGTFEGELITKGRLVVGSTGSIKGTVSCAHCETEGQMEGNILVQELFVLKSSAKVHGEIQYGQLSVENGAQATGNLHLSSKVKDIKDAGRERSVNAEVKSGHKQTAAV